MKPVMCDLSRLTLQEISATFGEVDGIKHINGHTYAIIGSVEHLLPEEEDK